MSSFSLLLLPGAHGASAVKKSVLTQRTDIIRGTTFVLRTVPQRSFLKDVGSEATFAKRLPKTSQLPVFSL